MEKKKSNMYKLLGGLLVLSMGMLIFIQFNRDTKKMQRRVFNNTWSTQNTAAKRIVASVTKRSTPSIQHRFQNTKDHPKQSIDRAFLQEFNKTMNLDLQRPTPEVLPEIIQQNLIKMQYQKRALAIPGASSNAAWVELGPNNVGGRTRTVTWDPNDPLGKKVWAGGVSGGLWYNNDITNINSFWNKVDDFWQTLSINKIVFDTLDKKIAYVTTGEGYTGNTSSGIGAGIWKTVDGGANWEPLPATKSFAYSNDIAIRNENGKSVIYAAMDANSYMGQWSSTSNVGLFRSLDNGLTWAQTLPIIDSVNTNKVPFAPASIQISKNNTIWVGTKASPNSNNNRGGGYILSSKNGLDWTVVKKFNVTNGKGRITLATAPSDEKVIYAFVENDNKLENLYRSDDEGVTWTTLAKPIDYDTGIPAADFTRGQAWYDQSMAVDPNNPSTVIVGGIDLFKSVDGGTSWQQISKWYNWNSKYSYVHADQHAITYKPKSSSTALFANDGGVFYTNNLLSADTMKVMNQMVKGYNVTQFYAGAIHPFIGKNFFLAGSQDNGTQKFLSPSFAATTTVYGGDGAFCFIDQTNPKFQIASYVGNSYYLSSDSGVSFNRALIRNTDLGSFINPATYDNNLHILYANSSKDYLVRIKNITTTPILDNVTIPNLSNLVTALKVSPYNQLSTTLFLGTSAGKLLKVTNADSLPSTAIISGPSFPSGSISCIEIGSSENELLVTFFNYGLKKIWYTADGGKNWVDKMGDFPNIPVRWSLFNPNRSPNQVILATELGIYATSNFSSAAPNWTQSNNGFANVRTDMLQMRNSDYAVIAATHGRGLFFSNAFSEAPAPSIINFSPKIGPTGTKITIKGSNFLNASEVRFGGLPAVSFKVESDTLISALVGIAYPGSVNVKTPGGIASLGGFSTNPPKITSFLPKSGGNGIPIIINGNNLSEITKLEIGGKLVKDFIVESSSKIVALIPDSTVNGKVIISNEFYADSLAGFTTCATPTLSKTTDTAFCVGNKFKLTSSEAPQYQWINNGLNINNAITASFEVSATGSYQIKTITNSCEALSLPVKITVNPLPLSPTIRDTFYCNNSIVDTLRAIASSGNTLLWYAADSVGALGNSIAPVPTTSTVGSLTYFVSQINNATKCEGPKSKLNVVINPIPSLPLVTDSAYCQNNASAALAATSIAGHSLLWYGTNAVGGTASTKANIASTIDTALKIYYVSQKNNLTNCESARAKINATIIPAPSIPSIKDAAYCINTPTDTLKAGASNAHILNWYNAAVLGDRLLNAPLPNSTIVGVQNYYVSQTANNTNCTSLRGKIMVTINALPLAPVVRDTFYCQNVAVTDSLKPAVLNAHSLIWYGSDSATASPNSISPKVSTATIGFQNYYVSQKNNLTGCEGIRSKISVEVRSNPTAPNLYRDTTNDLVATSSSKNTWYKDGVVLADTSQRYKPSIPGSYTVRTTALGCSSILSAPYYYLVTDILKLNENEFIKLAPNPFMNQLNFDFFIKGYLKLNIEIYNVSTGNRVDARMNLTAGTPLQLGLLAPGTYIFRVTSNDNKIVQQFKLVKL